MKKTITLLSALTAVTLSAQVGAQVENGTFESWSGNSPDSWTTIDSGISVSQSATSYEGNSAAAITVTTGSQSSTDFRQAISVTGGENYTFSTWVYHTEGGIRARLYVDGYQNYSNATLTGQWQQITYNFTPASTGTIEVGLRFYDVAGFDGNELVYVDLFEPTSTTGGGGTCSTHAGEFALTTDDYGSETSWQITDSGSQVVASGSGYSSNTSYREDVCLADGDYTLTVSDSYGDGICCTYGNGSYSLTIAGDTVAAGGSFGSADVTNFTLGGTGGGSGANLTGYYASADGLTGYALKTELHNIINNHTTQSYSALWDFYLSYGRDSYYENDGSILDIYSEQPGGMDPYTFTAGSDQCGNYSGEGDCYNREHGFPRSWFGGAVAPMNTDIHHIFPTDGYVNSKRSSYPYGEVASASFTSANGSKLGSATGGLGYTGTVFEPIDEFKGDIARAYFYMATRYENVIAGWENQSAYGDASLNGTSNQVFENWLLAMLKSWHVQDPVSQKEIDRNDAAYGFQGNRNPFVDHPELVTEIWGN